MQRAAAAGPPSDAALLGRWLADLGRRSEAQTWLEGLPPAQRAAPAVMDIAAELSAENGDFTTLDRLLGEGAWGSWPKDARALALAARLQALQADPAAARKTWNRAVVACGDSLVGLRALGRLAVAWHDEEGAETAWLAIIDHNPQVSWAYTALRASYLARHDRTHLLQLYGRWVVQTPHDDAVAAEWITLGCVLDRVSPDMVARARLLNPEVPGVVAAQAAVLWRRGDARAAEAILAALPAAERTQPAIAFWIALVTADLGPPTVAATALAEAERAPHEGEEQALLRAAAAKIGAPGT
jgi:hypothetical protein